MPCFLLAASRPDCPGPCWALGPGPAPLHLCTVHAPNPLSNTGESERGRERGRVHKLQVEEAEFILESVDVSALALRHKVEPLHARESDAEIAPDVDGIGVQVQSLQNANLLGKSLWNLRAGCT